MGWIMRLRTSAVVIFVLGLLYVPGISVCGQKTSSAAKADSPVREIVRNDLETSGDTPEKYRAAIQRLSLDYKTLMVRFEDLRSTARSQPFRNVIIAHLVARKVNPFQSDPTALRILDSLKTGNTLEKSLRLALSLDTAAIRKYRRAAEKELRSAL